MLHMNFYFNRPKFQTESSCMKGPIKYPNKSVQMKILFLFDLILYVPSTIFQLNRDGSSWVEPVLSKDKCVFLKDQNAVTPVRLEPSAPWSRVKHSTTEPLRFLQMKVILLYFCSQTQYIEYYFGF